MTELQQGGAVGPTDSGGAEADTELVPEVADLFIVLGKAFRAYQLYDENNPVRQRFVEGLRSALGGLWNRVGRLRLDIEEDRIVLDGTEVYRSDNRGDSLAFLFYKDGVREITFLPGIEGDELGRFLGVLQKARKLLPEGDDLLTVLWEEDLQCFQYRYVDFLAEGVELPVPGEGGSAEQLQGVLEAEVGEEGEEDEDAAAEDAAPSDGAAAKESARTVSKEDFNPTLYALDPKELQLLQIELQREFNRDLRGDVLAALFDRLEEPDEPERQSEIIGILGTLLPNFLSRGEIGPSTRVLEELRVLEERAGLFDERRREEIGALLDEVSREEFITELIQALYDGTLRASPKQLAGFLEFLRGGALAPLLRATEEVEHRELQAVLRKATKGIAERNRGAVLRLLGEADAVVAKGAAHIAGELQIAEAGPALADLLAHRDPSVRLAAVEAAVSLKASTAAGALIHTLDDPERDVRIAAAKALGVLRYRPSAERLAELAVGKEIRSADISEKVAVFEAYGRVAEREAVPVLGKLLNGKGFLGKREPAEIRAAAALALAHVTDPAADAALREASREEDPVVRAAVNRAMRSED